MLEESEREWERGRKKEKNKGEKKGKKGQGKGEIWCVSHMGKRETSLAPTELLNKVDMYFQYRISWLI